MKCMVIDGNSIINRAYYGIRPLTNREGLYTHAVFGFLTTLLRLKEEERPDALCVTFDLHAPTFRHKADEAYKATRKPMPEELRMQVPVLKEVLDTLNIPRYEMEGWEADDLIGTISRKCEAAGWDCVVVTGDKDSLQLITDHTKVKLVSTRMGQTTTKDMTPETFREQYGFEPIHMIDLKALMGDTSDNIPGVPGVGEKTAMDLIQKYGSVDAIYEKLPDIDAKPAAIKKLTAGEDAARHSYWLATIVTDAPLSFDPAENRVQEPTPAAYPLFLKLEFSKLIEKMGLRSEEMAPADAAPDVTVTAERITEESRAREVLELFRKADHVTVLALPDLSGVIADCDTGADTALSAEFFFERYTGDWNALLNALFAADIKKVSHNVKDLMRTLLENGLNAEGFMFDTALAAYLVDATSGKYEIGQLFAGYFHTELVKPVHLEPDAFSLLGDVTAAEAAFHSYTSAVDALYGVLAPKLKELDLWDLYATAELPLCRVLAEMERTGCRVDAKALSAFGELLSTTVVSEYLASAGVANHWVDMRRALVTQQRHKDASVDIDASAFRLLAEVEGAAETIFVGQGFIGGAPDGTTTTLGREGSDYSAAVVANILGAESMSVWKDVDGVLNADPKTFPDAEQIKELNYLDTIELAYSGAQIIHPKTIKPLQNKNIPLYVRPFGDKRKPGTVIRGTSAPVTVPILILKKDQVFLTVRSRDFSFVLEERLADIFSVFGQYRQKINLIQSSAVNLSLCVDDSRYLERVVDALQTEFRVVYNRDMELLTIRGYDQITYDRYAEAEGVFLVQKTRRTARIVRSASH